MKKTALDRLFNELYVFNKVLDFLEANSGTVSEQIDIDTVVQSFLLNANRLMEFLSADDDNRCNLNRETIVKDINNILTNFSWDGRGREDKLPVLEFKQRMNDRLSQFFSDLHDDYFPTNEGKEKGDFMKLII
ncbi:hypothetical protein ACFL2A_06210 [Thermodesulfobacteriota bacterium]